MRVLCLENYQGDLGGSFFFQAVGVAILFLGGLDSVDGGLGDGPVVAAAAFDGVFTHQIDVIEQLFAVAGGVIEDGSVGGN